MRNKMRKFVYSFLPVFLIISSAFLFVIFIMGKDETTCDEHVVLNDGEEYDCCYVTSYENNMSSIRKCDGTSIKVPTSRIKEIRKK